LRTALVYQGEQHHNRIPDPSSQTLMCYATPICHPDRSAAEGLQFHCRALANVGRLDDENILRLNQAMIVFLGLVGFLQG
jgi:hypothetical protein